MGIKNGLFSYGMLNEKYSCLDNWKRNIDTWVSSIRFVIKRHPAIIDAGNTQAHATVIILTRVFDFRLSGKKSTTLIQGSFGSYSIGWTKISVRIRDFTRRHETLMAVQSYFETQFGTSIATRNTIRNFDNNLWLYTFRRNSLPNQCLVAAIIQYR